MIGQSVSHRVRERKTILVQATPNTYVNDQHFQKSITYYRIESIAKISCDAISVNACKASKQALHVPSLALIIPYTNERSLCFSHTANVKQTAHGNGNNNNNNGGGDGKDGGHNGIIAISNT